jgi:hypothetical protein
MATEDKMREEHWSPGEEHWREYDGMCGGCFGAKERERTVVELHLEERVLVALDLELHRAVDVVLPLDLLLA